MVRRLALENKELKAQNKRLAKQAKKRILSVAKNNTLRTKVTRLENLVDEIFDTYNNVPGFMYWMRTESEDETCLPKTRREYMRRQEASKKT